MRRLVAMALFLAGGTACIPVAHTWDEREEFPIVERPANADAPEQDPATLRVMTWNVKFGGGRVDFFFDGWGDRVHMEEDEVFDNIDAMVALINEQDPDVLMAQEVDISSKRSAYVDMVDAILARTEFRYAAWVPAWHVDYIPQDGLGQIEMGQAVFSKYPITRNVRVDLPQGKDQGAFVNYFYLHRAIQITEVDLGGSTLTVINNHPTAYDQDGTKLIHMAKIFAEAEKVDGPLIVGGDFNVIPPGSINLDDFADQAPIDTRGASEVVYTVEETESLLPFYDAYQPVVPLDEYANAGSQEAQSAYFSHSLTETVFWQMKLDYLFTNQSWSEGEVLQKPGDGDPATVHDPMALSDHAPMTAVLVLE